MPEFDQLFDADARTRGDVPAGLLQTRALHAQLVNDPWADEFMRMTAAVIGEAVEAVREVVGLVATAVSEAVPAVAELLAGYRAAQRSAPRRAPLIHNGGRPRR